MHRNHNNEDQQQRRDIYRIQSQHVKSGHIIHAHMQQEPDQKRTEKMSLSVNAGRRRDMFFYTHQCVSG
jgi:hypothetical protein